MTSRLPDIKIGLLQRNAADKKRFSIALSGTGFHHTVMKRYKVSKNRPFSLPMMLFLKNNRFNSILQNRIDIQLKLFFDHIHYVSSSSSKKIRNIQQLSVRFKADKLLPQLTEKLTVIQKNTFWLSRFATDAQLNSLQVERGATPIPMEWFRSGRSQSQQTRKRIIEKKYRSLLKAGLALPIPSTERFAKEMHDEKTPNPVSIDSFYTSDPKKTKFVGHHFLFESNIAARVAVSSSALHPKTYISSRFYPGSPGMTGWRRGPLDHKQPFTKHAILDFLPTDPVPAPIKPTFMRKDFEGFTFRSSQQMEQVVEEIQKIAAETKKTLTEKPFSSSSTQPNVHNSQLDLNHLSNQIYHNIERRIRMERERRGL